MGIITEVDNWDASVYLLEPTDPVLGGPDGPDNKAATNLANRTKHLRARLQDGAPTYAVATGTANAHTIALTPALVARVDGMMLRYKAPAANTGAVTLTDGVAGGAAPVVGANHAALQGGEFVANGDAVVMWNSSIGGGSYILLACTGGARQTAPATQSGHAVAHSQVIGLGQSWQNMTGSRAQGTTYTNTTGKPIALSICSGTAASSGVALTVGGLAVASSLIQLAGGSFVAGVFAIVPPGVTYSVTSWNTGSWFELR